MKLFLKLTLLILFLFTSIFPGISQDINQKVTDDKGREKLLGKVTKNAFMKDSFAEWFNFNYESYTVDKEALKPIEKKFADYEIIAFMGTWCGDSKREVPRFYKILETANYPAKNLTMITLDNTKLNYKKSPGGEEKGHNIIKVPTFILLKNGKEINRIVESPKVSLEKDLAAILNGNVYIPNYSTAVSLPQD